VTAEVASDRNESENESVRSDTANLSEVTALSEVTEPLSEVTEPLSEVTEPLSEVTEPLSEVTSPEATDGGSSKLPRDPLLRVFEEGKTFKVDDLIPLVQAAAKNQPYPPSAGSKDSAPASDDKPVKGQQAFPDFGADESSETPRKSWKKLAVILVTFWAVRAGHVRARVTPKRALMVKKRLQEGYSDDDLRRAIAGVCYSPFHREGGYDTIEVAIRSSEQVEKGIRYWLLYAPIEFIAQHELSTGIKVPERAEELSTYLRRQAAAARAAEREKEAEQREKEARGQQQASEPQRPKSIEELRQMSIRARQKREEEQELEREISSCRNTIKFLGDTDEKEMLEDAKRDLERLLKEKAIREMKTNNQ
jgi:hypothetical protein